MLITTPFVHHRPTSVSESLALLADLGEAATVYAGGTELIPVLKMGLASFDHLIDLKRISELGHIAHTSGSLSIGAVVTHHRLANDPVIRRVAPYLAEAAAGIGNVRVRVTGTLGGNLCFAEPRSDPLTLLSALSAEVTLTSREGNRLVPVAEFVTGPYTTARRPDEILLNVVVPETGTSVGFGKLAVAERPTASVACARRRTADGGDSLTVAVGSVGPLPFRTVRMAVDVTDEASVTELCNDVAGQCDAVSDQYGSEDYKRHLVRVLTGRAVRDTVRPNPDA